VFRLTVKGFDLSCGSVGYGMNEELRGSNSRRIKHTRLLH